MQIDSSQTETLAVYSSVSIEDRTKATLLIQQLKTDDLELLNQSVQDLLQIAPNILPVLIESLVSADDEIRKNIAWVLGFLQEAQTIKPLLHVMSTDANVDVRLSASWALRQMNLKLLSAVLFTKLSPPESLDDIKDYILSKSWKARWYCTVFLILYPEFELLEPLMTLARSDENVVVRCRL